MKLGQSPPKPVSLYPLTLEQAVKELLKAKPEPKKPKSETGKTGEKKLSE